MFPGTPHGVGITGLTQRERDVMDAYIRVGNQKLVGPVVGLSHQTVKNHVSRILIKLDVVSSLQAAVLYDRWVRGESWPAVERRHNTRDRRYHERRIGKERRNG